MWIGEGLDPESAQSMLVISTVRKTDIEQVMPSEPSILNKKGWGWGTKGGAEPEGGRMVLGAFLGQDE